MKFFSTKNNINPINIFRKSQTKYIFECDICLHTFNKSLDKIYEDKNHCPYCATSSSVLCDDENCKFCYEKSFNSNPKAIYWSDKNIIKPRHIMKKSSNKYWFNCPDCKHEFERPLCDIKNDSFCPYCAVPSKILCDDEKCKSCFTRSFASEAKLDYWSEKNNISPRLVLKNSNKKYFFNCSDCKHEFSNTLDCVILLNQWCPFCGGNQLCQNNDCNYCYNRSFASNPKSIYWCPTNKINPRQVFKASSNKYNFICNYCSKQFSSTIDHIHNGSWCPYCYNKTEKTFYTKIKNIYKNLIHRFSVKWCKNIKELPFDFVLPNDKIIIELDGGQHFKQVSNWKSPEETQKTDIYKMKCANLNGYSVIRILQLDVYYNKYDWIKEIINTIELIKIQNKVQNIYLSKSNEYDTHKKLMIEN